MAFTETAFGDIRRITITNNVMAGGHVIYRQASGSADSVLGPITVTNNHFSWRLFFKDGYWGTSAYVNHTVTTWSGNIWDDALAEVPGS